VTPECASAWRNYECKVNDTGYERRTQDAFEAGWQAGWAQRGIADKTTVQVTIKPPPEMIDGPAIDFSTPTPSVGHVCVGPQSSRKPGLCWICGQALPHDCVGGAQQPAGCVAQFDAAADRLDGFELLPDAQTTHGPPQKVEMDFAAAELRVLTEAAKRKRDDDVLCGCSLPPHTIAQCVVRGVKRLTVAGRKWPIGTPDETVYGSAYSTADEWHLRLRAARINCGLTLDALARRLDPPRTRKDISAMEHGRRGLSVELCAQLADALDCDRLWLAGW